MSKGVRLLCLIMAGMMLFGTIVTVFISLI